jgi:hypothetical protein
MTTDFATSNLSKIKPKLRTEGKATGNFGVPKRTREAYNSGIGMTKTKVIKITKQEDYLNRLYVAFEATNDPKLKKFIYQQIKQILIKKGQW